MIRRTFQHIQGVGPWKEKDLWARGIRSWDDFPDAGTGIGISAKQDSFARSSIATAREALAKNDVALLGELFPQREHWRLYDAFEEDALYFDIETDGQAEQNPTVVSLFDRDGLHVFIRGRNMDALPAAMAKRRVWVSFNGSCFDVPVLRQHFEAFPVPALHLDLRFIWRRLGMGMGLKALEDHFGLSRPLHLRGVDGWDAVLLWRAFHDRGDLEALRFLVEYNLYDAINLKSLMDLAYNQGIERLNLDEQPRRVFDRGEVLYDVSKRVLELGPEARDLEVLARLRPKDRQLRDG